jgi:hypothetical protein
MTNAEPTNENANAAERNATVAPETSGAKKTTSQKAAPKGKKAAEPTTPFDGPGPGAKPAKAVAKGKATKKAAKAKKAPKAKPDAERSNKKADVISLMKRAKGATLAEIIEATNWQAHTVRGFISLLGSKDGVKVESTKNAGERTYRVAK